MNASVLTDIKAVIFDRDGVLIHDCGYPHLKEHLEWMPGALNSLAYLKMRGIVCFVATNQAGVARGYYTEQSVHNFHGWMIESISASGGNIQEFVYCPHLENAVIERYRVACNCRKPKPGMIYHLLEKFKFSPSEVIMIGDKDSDVAAASSAGVRGYLYHGGNLLDFLKGILPDIMN